ncbi:MAG: hypothetical protein LBS21_12570 [Clostridiales bacterium]|jgi:hypothetical protein|nr:hypothetical protein [Clostridiales bacterium]
MKRPLKKFTLLVLIFSLMCSVGVSAADVNGQSELLDYKLYCEDRQINLSTYPLLNVFNESGEPNIYIAVNFYSIPELLGYYTINFPYGRIEYYTRGYLEETGEWISRADAEETYKLHKRAPGTMSEFKYYEGDHSFSFYYTSIPALNEFKTASRGRDGYIKLDSFIYYLTDSRGNPPETLYKSDQPDKYRQQGVTFEEIIYPNSKDSFTPTKRLEMDYHIVNNDRKMSNRLNDEPIGDEFDMFYISAETNKSPDGNSTRIALSILNSNYSPYYVNLKATYESLGCAVITDAANKTVFIYSQSFLDRSPNWVSKDDAERLISIDNILNKGKSEITMDFTTDSLILKTATASVTVNTVVANKEPFVKSSDFKNALKKLKAE